MIYFRHGDPLDDFDRLEWEEREYMESLPVCDICDEPIQEDHYYQINGDNICPGCLEHFKKVIG